MSQRFSIVGFAAVTVAALLVGFAQAENPPRIEVEQHHVSAQIATTSGPGARLKDLRTEVAIGRRHAAH